jgi:hypothetical protein
MAKVKAPFVAGFYTDPDAFVAAASASKQAGWATVHEGFMPYPVHAAFDALGIQRSRLGRPVLFLLLFGAFLGFIMQWWMLAIDWPILISGKSYNSWPAYVVITFETGVLIGGVANLLLLLLVYCKLMPDPVTRVIRQRLTDDQFCLVIPIEGERSEQRLREFFEQHQADDVQRCASDQLEPDKPIGNPFTA